MRPDGKSKGIAFVSFGSSKEATKALNGENGKDMDGRSLKIRYSADKPEDFGNNRDFGNRNGGSGGD